MTHHSLLCYRKRKRSAQTCGRHTERYVHIALKAYKIYKKRENCSVCLDSFTGDPPAIHLDISMCLAIKHTQLINTQSQHHGIDRLISWNQCEYSQLSFPTGGTGHQDAATEMHHTAGTISPGSMTSTKLNWFVSHNSIFMRLLLASLSITSGVVRVYQMLVLNMENISHDRFKAAMKSLSKFCGF